VTIEMPEYRFSVNDEDVSITVEDRTLLVTALRDALGLCGTNIGCDTSQCGACTVHLNGRAIKSCTILTAQVDGQSVRTIESLATEKQLHPMQAAFQSCHALQCGYCTPGMIMQALELVRRHGFDLDETTIRDGLEGNICRCTGYHNVVQAIRVGAAAMGSLSAAQRGGDSIWHGETPHV
jgi:aerobic carbon-monoxide dehydrogenase small subunit